MCTIVLRLSIVEVKGKGNFTGTKTIEYTVEQADLIYSTVWYNGMDEDTQFTVIAPDVKYNTKKNGFKSAVVVKENATGKTLGTGTNYKGTYETFYQIVNSKLPKIKAQPINKTYYTEID